MGRGEKEKGRWWKENEGKEVEEEVDRWRVGRRVFRAMGNETWSLVLCLWNVRIKRKRNILVAWKVKELRDWKETPDDTYIYIYILEWFEERMFREIEGWIENEWISSNSSFVGWQFEWLNGILLLWSLKRLERDWMVSSLGSLEVCCWLKN